MVNGASNKTKQPLIAITPLLLSTNYSWVGWAKVIRSCPTHASGTLGTLRFAQPTDFAVWLNPL